MLFFELIMLPLLQLWWTSSRFPSWLQPMPVTRTNHTPSSPPNNASSSQPARREEGAKDTKRERTKGNTTASTEEKGAGSGGGRGLGDEPRHTKLPDATAAARPTAMSPAALRLDSVASSAAVPRSNGVGVTSGTEFLGHATQAPVIDDKPLCPPVPPKLGLYLRKLFAGLDFTW